MQLNLSIIYDRLQRSKRLILEDPENYTCILKGIRLNLNFDRQSNNEYLYVASSEDVKAHLDVCKGLTLLIVGDIDETLLLERGIEAIILHEECSLTELADELSSIFEYYSRWYDRLLSTLANNRSLQEVFDIGTEVLDNPLALLDISMALIIMSGRLPADVSNTIWELLLTEGHTPTSLVPKKLRLEIDTRIRSNEPPFVVTVPRQWRDKSWMVCGIFVNGKHFGSFGSVELFAPFTAGQLSLLTVLKQVVELALLRSPLISADFDDFSFMLERMIRGFSVDPKIIEYHLKQRRWHTYSKFRLISVRCLSTGQKSETIGKYYYPLQQVLPQAVLLTTEEDIIIIEQLSEQSPNQAREDNLSVAAKDELLQDLMDEQELQAGVSLVFSDLSFLGLAYKQSQQALLSATEGAKAVSYFQREFTACLLSAVEETLDPLVFCHPQVLHLWKQGSERDRENLLSLEAYLLRGSNLSATAKELHVHRNTLDYRLEKVSKALDIDLGTLNSNDLFLLQFSCRVVAQLG